MRLLDLCPASVDECFSSWIYRCMIKFPWVRFSLEGVSVKAESDRCGELVYEDPDFDISSSYVQDVTSRLNLAQDDYFRFFDKKPGKLLSWQSRRFYCRDCVMDDIKNNILPYWRRSWCSAVCVFCPLHEKKLSSIRFNCDPIGRGWRAFSEFSRYPYHQYQGTRNYNLWESESLQKALYDLAIQVFEWYGSSEEARVDSAGADVASTAYFDLVFELLTQAPSLHNSGGLSWSFTFAFKLRLGRYRKDYSWLLENGVNEVDVNQRVCGVILAGKVLGILSDEEVGRLDCMVDDLFPYFGLSNLELGFRCANYSSIGDYDYLLSRIGRLPYSSQARFDGFVAGLTPEM